MTVIAGRYRLLDVLGQGGMGTVWRARDEVLGRDVAVKEVRAPAGLAGDDERRLYSRLEREAWAAARISHRNVVTVYDVATEDGRPWIVMELIRGLTLSDVLDAEGRMSPQRAAHIGAEVLAALRAAHEAGVLHRDVKPGNVLLANDGRVVLTDFGIAAVEGTSPLTMTGELIGSPEFLAPERALGRTPGPASDLWSLGVLLYAAVEGNSPFRQDTPLSTLRAVVDEELPPPRRAGALAPVIEGLLHKDPRERLQAASAERQLRIVGAGGTPGPASSGPVSSGSVPSEPYEPKRPASTGAPTPPLPLPVPPPTSASPLPQGPMTQDRSGRAVAVLAAGVVLLLLAVGGLTYALLRNGGGGAGPGGGATSSAPVTGSPTGTPSTDSPTTAAPSSPTGTPTTATPPAPTVLVHVRAVRDSHNGACPPPEAQAPAFAAAVTVGRVPASVEYRWVTESGESSAEEGWRTLDFPAGGPAEERVEHTELTHRADGTWKDRIRLEVRAPVEKRSNWVAFSVTCEQATPTGGVTSPSGTPTPQP
ncbi:serine/threonine protein kinase [Streptomyces sp. Je 1-79]|uniref:serine/threonine-protein kinase n=1 Tax=Streptomyces sp. Je 1-79 TaxID=2943847 RepID=UPI0021A335F3|nr:serine/threonine-protein kinase [Streptomyces sp. Je 1-79]MCT4357355.1 serine/threonine protein kinase [Streptomyces sp. Je 1-79]